MRSCVASFLLGAWVESERDEAERDTSIPHKYDAHHILFRAPIEFLTVLIEKRVAVSIERRLLEVHACLAAAIAPIWSRSSLGDQKSSGCSAMSPCLTRTAAGKSTKVAVAMQSAWPAMAAASPCIPFGSGVSRERAKACLEPSGNFPVRNGAA